MFANGLSDLSQLLMGALTDALPDQPQEPLQQSQYRVVFPLPLWATADPVARARRVMCWSETSILGNVLMGWMDRSHVV